MSRTFGLTGTGSALHSHYRPSIDLSDGSYGLGLVGFYSYNALRNIHEGNDKIYWKTPEDASWNVLQVPGGAYEITALNEYVGKKLLLLAAPARQKESSDGKVFSLEANTNTLKCVVESRYEIDFKPSDSIGRMLGFSPRTLEAGEVHESDLDVRISPATNIKVNCNITAGSYLNGVPDHTIYEFAMDSEPGELLIKEPSSVIYLPVLVDVIEDISVWLTDQNGGPVNFGAEQVAIRLELKKWG